MKYTTPLKTTLIAASLSLIALPLLSQATTVDLRGGYKTGTHSYESRLRISNNWSNGFQGALETDMSNGTHSFNEFRHMYDEAELNYTYPINNQFSVTPGAILHWSAKGSQYRPYFKVNYKIAPNIFSAIRYRFDRYNYQDVDMAATQHKGSLDTHRIDVFLTYNINPQWSLSYMGTYYRYVHHEMQFANGKRSGIENAFTAKYNYNKYVSPYIEYDYLGKLGYDYATHKGNITENRIRVGVTLNNL